LARGNGLQPGPDHLRIVGSDIEHKGGQPGDIGRKLDAEPGKAEEDNEDLDEKGGVSKDLDVSGPDDMQDFESGSPGGCGGNAEDQAKDDREKRDLAGKKDSLQEKGKIPCNDRKIELIAHKPLTGAWLI
jgi:hypothetical protein